MKLIKSMPSTQILALKKIFIVLGILIIQSNLNAEEVKEVGKFKDWTTLISNSDGQKICFAQSKPVLQSPKSSGREARLFVTFRPQDKVSDEISITAGYEFNTSNTISAKTGKKKYKFDIQQNSFAWIADGKIEKRMIKSMKKGSRIMVIGYNKQNSQTIAHYSLMGFTKAYNAAKKNCT